MENIKAKMEDYFHIFNEYKLKGEKSKEGAKVTFDKVQPIYKSLAAEGFSMGLAVQSIEKNDNLELWLPYFNEYKELYKSQLLVGLGWAFNFTKFDFKTIIEAYEPEWSLKILDGIGYSSAMLSRRQTIRSQIVPDYIDKDEQKGFDQGVGRSLWYICKGDETQLSKMLGLFSTDRHDDLYRGIGLAASIIGEMDADKQDRLIEFAQTNIDAFRKGVLLAKKSLKKAKLTNQKDEIWFEKVIGNVDLQFESNSKSTIGEFINQIQLSFN